MTTNMNELKTLQEEKELLQNHGEKRIRDLSDYRFASEEARLGIIHIVRHEIMKAFEKAHTLGIMKGVELVEGELPKYPPNSDREELVLEQIKGIINKLKQELK